MNSERSSSPMIFGVHARLSPLIRDERHKGFYNDIIDVIVTFFGDQESSEALQARLKSSPTLEGHISSMVDSHLIDLRWIDAVNPADSKEMAKLREASGSLLSLLESLSREAKVSIDYEPRALRQQRGENALLHSVASAIVALNIRIDRIRERRTPRGRKAKVSLKRMCILAVSIWIILSEKAFPKSFTINDGEAGNIPLQFVHKVVRSLIHEVTVEEVRYQPKQSSEAINKLNRRQKRNKSAGAIRAKLSISKSLPQTEGTRE